MRNLHKTDAMSQALAEPSRRALLENLRLGPKSVTELVHATQLKQPNVSNHLAKMREQGIVRAERKGRQVYYALATPVAATLMRLHEVTADPLATTQLAPPANQPSVSSSQSVPAPSEPAATDDDRRHVPATNGKKPRLNEWQSAYFQSVLAGEEERATLLVNAMLAHRLDMQTIYSQVFQWALNRIGDLYQQGMTDEAHEHLASAITERLMAKVAQFYAPMARTTYRAVLGCVGENWHVLGLRMLADGLRGLGWETLFLGANVPTDSFVAMVASARPDLVVVSCSLETQTEELRRLVSELDAARRQQPELDYQIGIGGHYVNLHPELLRELPAEFSSPDLPHFLHTVETRFPPT